MNPRHGFCALAIGALVVAGCGSDDSDPASSEPPTDDTTPEVTEAADSSADDTGSSEPDDALDEEGDGDTASAGGTVDQAAIDAAAAAFLDEQAAQGVTAFYIAVSDPAAGDFSSAYGDASVDGPAATTDDSFRIGSISKTFTATAVLQLVESGDITLDDTVLDLLPALAAEHPELEPLTVRQLLSMQSGVADYLNMVDTVVPVIVDEPTTVWAAEDLITAGVEAGVDAPGTLGYSTTNFIVLQLIVESVTGSPLADVIADEIVGPLGLDGIFLPPNDDTTLPTPATHGYLDGGCLDELADDGATVEPGTDVTDWNASYGQGGGGMTSDLAGLLGWAASGSGNALLDDATVADRLELEVLPEGIPYGLGMMQLNTWIGHEGEAIGWEALVLQDLDSGASIAMAGNGCGGLFTGFLDALGMLYPDSLEGLDGG